MLFLNEMIADMDWRVSQMATLKSLPIRYGMSIEHRKIQIKFTIPAIYAIWEGFVKTIFQLYIKELNNTGLKRKEISEEILTHYLDSICNFKTPREHFSTKIKIALLIDSNLTESVSLSQKVKTNSNVNLKVLDAIFEKFCIKTLDRKYMPKLNRFLFLRNSISHGENSVSVEMKDLVDNIDLVEDLMVDTILSLEDAFKRKSYKK